MNTPPSVMQSQQKTSANRVKTTIYTPSHNYGAYLPQALDSILAQTVGDWELFIIDEGSTDDTLEIAKSYQARDPERIHVIHHEKPWGLFRCANQIIESARGSYVMRLDADDYLDENAILVMSHYLDNNPNVALVFPNYFYVDQSGQYIHTENRKRIGVEASLLDLPAHGACTMVRRRILKAVGGYSEDIRAQDGHELWIKIARRYPVANIPTPLFYYRQHGASLSRDVRRLLDNRAQIKRMAVERDAGAVKPRTVAVIPAKFDYPGLPGIALHPVADKLLIDHTIENARACGRFDHILVSTDSRTVIDHCRQSHPDVLTHLRPPELSSMQIRFSRIVNEAVVFLEENLNIHPDIIVALSIHTPLRRRVQVEEAIDTLMLYDCDSVISVTEIASMNFRHGRKGLEPLNPAVSDGLRLERELLFEDNRAIKAMWRDIVRDDDIYGDTISHVVMPRQDSYIVSSPEMIWLADRLLTQTDG